MASQYRESPRRRSASRSEGARPWCVAAVAALALAAIAAGCGRKPATTAGDEADRLADDSGPGRNTIVPVVPIFGPELEPPPPHGPARTVDPRDEPPEPRPDHCRGDTDSSPYQAVDVIVSLGGFGSAAREISWLAQELGSMATFLARQGIDAHFVLVGGPDVCVHPPLGGPDCGDSSRYRYLPRWSRAEEALPQLLEQYPQYAGELREDSYRVIIALVDDTPWAHEPPEPLPPPIDGELLALLEGNAGDARFFGLTTLTAPPKHLTIDCAYIRPDLSFRLLERATGGVTEIHCGRERTVWADFFETVSESVRSEVHERTRQQEGC